jgi:hypothetical protein
VLTEVGDRRRIAAATIVTFVALPALWLTTADDERVTSPALAVVGGAGDAAVIAPAGAAATVPPVPTVPDTDATPPPVPVVSDDGVDPFAPSDPVFLAGPTLAPIGQPQVAYADPGSSRRVDGRASYRRWEPEWGTNPCHSPYAPANARLTVTNLDNGQSINCTNVVTKPIRGSTVVVLDTQSFLLLANLTEAPIPVRVTW